MDDVARQIVERFNPFTVILFGSYAWGKPNKDSDFDLLIVMDPHSNSRAWRGEVRFAVVLPRGVSLDLVIYTPQEFATRLAMKDFFVLRILEKGRTLYERGRPWETLEVHPTMTILEEWVGKAEGDYRMAVDINRRRKDPIPDGVTFHCQQCAEKYPKAFLIHHSQAPEKTHELEDLLRECEKIDGSLFVLLAEVQFLDKFSVDPRYPGYFASVEEAEDALAAARKVRKIVRKSIGL